MKKFLILIIMLPGIAYAQYFEPLSKKDIILQGIFTGLTFIDMMQTKKFVAKGIPETNPILSRSPSQQKIENLIFAGIVGHALVTYAIFPEYREGWQSVFIGIEHLAVCHNHSHNYSHVLDKNLDPICQSFTIEIVYKF